MIRLASAFLLIAAGLFVLLVATIGIFRFSSTLNRIHVAAKCDTLGALLVLSGLIVLSGFTVFSMKLLLVILFLWLTNPVASHLVALAEVRTHPDIASACDLLELAEDGELTPLRGPLLPEAKKSREDLT